MSNWIRMRKLVLLIPIGAVLVGGGGCINTFWRTVVTPVDPTSYAGRYEIRTPVKAHLTDGSTIIFRYGATVDNKTLTGSGQRFPMLSSTSVPAEKIALDSVVGLETYEGKRLVAKSVVVSTAATAVGTFATVLLLKAIFGSCPTVYADTGTGPLLQAEGFSYAIAPLLEQRDVDALRTRPDSDGVIRLDLRNEALETHFINHIELLAASHAPNMRVMPDQFSHPLAIGDVRAFSTARDRAGRDVRQTIATADGELFSSSPAITDAARPGDLDDWIDLEANDLPPSDSIAVVLRLRNSLLNTVLLYEGVLGGRDAPDWIETGLQHIGTAIDLSSWYTRTMGMRVSVDGAPMPAGQTWQARLGDVGPLAFRDVALVLPRPRGTRDVRVRLRFVADNWRIDYAAVAAKLERPNVTVLPVGRVVVPNPATGESAMVDTSAHNALHDSDGRYLETRPGQRMTLEFNAARSAGETTYLIAWQGYYREWIRGSWLATPARTKPWVPGDEAVLTAMRRWRGTQPEMERTFYSTRIPVK